MTKKETSRRHFLKNMGLAAVSLPVVATIPELKSNKDLIKLQCDSCGGNLSPLRKLEGFSTLLLGCDSCGLEYLLNVEPTEEKPSILAQQNPDSFHVYPHSVTYWAYPDDPGGVEFWSRIDKRFGK